MTKNVSVSEGVQVRPGAGAPSVAKTRPALDASQRRAATVAGAMFGLIIVGSIVVMNVLRPRFIIAGDSAATAAAIAAHDLLFRLATTTELLMAAALVPLAWALYVLLEPISRPIAQLALGFRLVEAALWCVAVLPIFMLGEASTGALETLVRANVVVMNVVILFTGLGTVVFSALLWRSRYVPRALAAWGVFTYLTMILFSIAKLVSPGLASWDLIVYTPGGLFEAVIGGWLLVLGLRASATTGSRAPASA